MSITAQTALPLVPPAEVHSRLARFQAKLAAAEVPVALMTHPVDVFYLTGTMPDGWLVVPAEGAPTLLVRKSLSRARYESPLRDIHAFPGTAEVAALLRRHGGAEANVGLESDVLPAAQYLRLAKELPGARWSDVSGIIRQVRAVKSAWEIKQHRQAARQHVATFQAIAEHLAPGMTELELSAIAEAAMRREGHQGLVRFRRSGMELWFCGIGTGLGTSYPTSFDGPLGSDGLHPASGMVAGVRPIMPHVPVMADILANHFGYHADIARTFCIGEPPEEIKRAHDFCRRALREVEARLLPGTPWGRVWEEVNDWARRTGEPQGFMGYGENRVKFFGHGIGLEVDEFPILAKGFAQPLEVGMVLAVEPKSFYRNLGPAGLEMSYVIEENGPQPLLAYPEDIMVI